MLSATLVAGTIALGAARMASWSALPPDHVAHVARSAWWADSTHDDRAPITLWGRVTEPATRSAWAIRLVIEADSAERGAVRRPVHGDVQVSLLLPDEVAPVYPALRHGDRVRLVGLLEPPPERRNPAQMDYGAYLRGRGTHATLRVQSETDVVFLAPSRRPLVRLATGVRRHIRTALGRHVPPDVRPVLLALLVADRSEIDGGTLDAFRETGLMHLLAVSGLHIGLVGLGL